MPFDIDKVYYDMMPDCTVSVFIHGEWDFFKSYSNLFSYCETEFLEYELISLTNLSFEERKAIIDGLK